MNLVLDSFRTSLRIFLKKFQTQSKEYDDCLVSKSSSYHVSGRAASDCPKQDQTRRVKRVVFRNQPMQAGNVEHTS